MEKYAKRTKTTEKEIPADYVIYKSASELVSLAEETIALLYEGEEFLASDLFPGYIWNRIPLATRLKFGSQFNDMKWKLDIAEIGKLSSNQMLYRKATREKK